MQAPEIVHTLEEIENRAADMRQRIETDAFAYQDLKRDVWAVGFLARQVEGLVNDIETDSLGDAC